MHRTRIDELGPGAKTYRLIFPESAKSFRDVLCSEKPGVHRFLLGKFVLRMVGLKSWPKMTQNVRIKRQNLSLRIHRNVLLSILFL